MKPIKSASMKTQLIKNIFSNYLAKAVAMPLGFVLVPFLIGKLGKDAFGLIVIAESTIVFFEILTISVRMALSRHAAFSLAKGKQEDFTQYLATGRYLLFLSSAVVLLSGFCLSLYFPDIFRVPDIYRGQSKVLFFLITVAFSATIPNIVYWSVLYAKQRFDLINLASSLALIFRALALFVLFTVLPKEYVSLPVYGFIYLAVTWTDNFLVFLWHKKVMPGLRLRFKDFRKSKVREILSFSTHTSIGRLSSLLYDNTANLIINLFWGTAANAVYSVSLKFPQIMRRLFVEPSWTLTPTFTELIAKNEHEKVKRLLFIYTRYISILSLPCCFILVILAEPLILFWVGKDFLQAADLMKILLAPLAVIIPFSATGCITNSHAKVRLPSRVALLVAFLNVGLAILLGKGFSMGLTGIAIASSTALILYFTLFSSYYACHVAKISVLEYWKKAFLGPLVCSSAIFGAGLWSIFVYAHPAGITWPFIFAGLGSVYFAVTYIGILDTGDRHELQRMLRKGGSLWR